MKNIADYLDPIVSLLSRPFGYDIFIERDNNPRYGLLDFERIRSDDVSTDYYGLGHHVIISNLRILKAKEARRTKEALETEQQQPFKSI